MSANILTVNLARQQPISGKSLRTGIDKIPANHPVDVRAPGPMQGGLGSGLVGDVIGNQQQHGGDDQAVYAYAREDLDTWQSVLHRDISNGMFGENLTTVGLDVTESRIGEQWTIGTGGLVLEVSRPRIPCRTFASWLAIPNWIKIFTEAAQPGAYLRVITAGPVRAGDTITVSYRPDHDISVALVFRALTREPNLLPNILDTPALAEPVRQTAARRVKTRPKI
ncbi:MAG: MOSC domain-containing protein [Mycobacteriaceae bacterium]|nr:MOSC domain-containing protein [Mycobacteriaceae bacterium]